MATVNVKDLQIVGGDLVAKVGEELKRLFPETKAAFVQFTDSEGATTDLATVIAGIIEELEKTATTENMGTEITKAVNKAVTELIGGAPEAMDTFKEVFDEFEKNGGLLESLQNGQLNKVDKVEGHSLVADTLIAILSKITNAKITEWDKAQANTLEEVKVNGVAQTIDGNKAVDIIVPAITVSATVPTDMKNGDMAFILHSAE